MLINIRFKKLHQPKNEIINKKSFFFFFQPEDGIFAETSKIEQNVGKYLK